MDLDVLPEELLADILHRLPPRTIAVCRSVSTHLRAVIDGRGLLAAHLAPVGLRGIFINLAGQDRPYFFSRQAGAAAPPPVVVDGGLSFLPPIGWREVSHHSNGLLLVKDWGQLYVCNPATQRWAHLPPRPKGFGDAEHLIFDPAVSLHYEVISFSEAPCDPSSFRAKHNQAEIKGSVEWPPSSYVAQVFSSRTDQWEERVYVREDDVAVTLFDVWSDPWGRDRKCNAPRCNAISRRGALYLHCRGGFVMRLSLREHKYRVINTPKLDNVFTRLRLDINDFLRPQGEYMGDEERLREIFELQQQYLDSVKPSMHLGKSKYGIYYTALIWHQLQVWVLHEASESCPMPEWELKHKADIEPYFRQHYTRENRKEIEKSWSLDNGKKVSGDRISSGWESSDDDNNMNVERGHCVNSDDIYDMSHMDLLGYHPSKDIAFLGNNFDGFSYYLGSSKLQYLGTFFPVRCTNSRVAATHESFIYTPCMYDLLPDELTVDTDEDEELEE